MNPRWPGLFLVMLAATASATAQDAQRLWDEGQRLEAIDTLARDLAEAPDRTDARAKLVAWEMQVHRYAKAIEHMEALGDTCREVRAQALYHLGDYTGALAGLSALDLDQALMRIDALEALSRFADASAAVDEALAHFSASDARLLACQGRRRLHDQRPAEAVSAFRTALDRDPWNREALYGLGRALVLDGKRTEGLTAMQRHRDLMPLLDQRDFAQQGVDLAPRHAPNLTALGDAERALGRTDAAIRAYEDAARCASDEEVVPNALRHARLLEEDWKDVEGAIKVLQRTAERVPSARLFVRMGDLRAAQGRWREALDLFQRAAKERPDDAEIKRRIDQTQREADRAKSGEQAK